MNNNNHELVRAEGIIERIGMTTYMYGDYTLVDPSGNIAYALRSSMLNLSEYVDHYVEITATRVLDYPLEGGPVYLAVETVTMRHQKNRGEQM